MKKAGASAPASFSLQTLLLTALHSLLAGTGLLGATLNGFFRGLLGSLFCNFLPCSHRHLHSSEVDARSNPRWSGRAGECGPKPSFTVRDLMTKSRHRLPTRDVTSHVTSCANIGMCEIARNGVRNVRSRRAHLPMCTRAVTILARPAASRCLIIDYTLDSGWTWS